MARPLRCRPRARRPRPRSEPEPMGARELRAARGRRVRLAARRVRRSRGCGIRVAAAGQPRRRRAAGCRRSAQGAVRALRRAASSTSLGLERRAARVRHRARRRAQPTPYTAQAVRARDSGAVRRVVATVWENIPLPGRREPARRAAGARGRRRSSTTAIAITERRPAAPRARRACRRSGSRCCRWASTSSASLPPPATRRDGPLRILCVTRLVSEKGVEDLVVALRLLADRGVDAELTLVGRRPAARRASRAMADELGVATACASRARCRTTGCRRCTAAQRRVRAGERAARDLARAVRLRGRRGDGRPGCPCSRATSGSLDEVVGDPAQLVRRTIPRRSRTRWRRSPATPSCAPDAGARNRAPRRGALRPPTRGSPSGCASSTSACSPSRPAPRSAARPRAPTTARPGRSRSTIARAAGSGPGSAPRPEGPPRRARECRRPRAPRT